ncbi:centrosomal protein of 131 kDa [Hetaerina americana]|uniref:centrosomal protein of 131 kDa n=1 Tax=Hetaerina americana TaxID=62018 RepID=UPI003A7F4558
MSECADLCLRGLQVNPKPRTKDSNDKASSKNIKINFRPYSASEAQKGLHNKRLENASRPKSANDISLNEKRTPNRPSKYDGHYKAVFRSNKMKKCPEANELNASEGQIKTSLKTTGSSVMRSGQRNEKHFYNSEERKAFHNPPSYVSDSHLCKPLVGTVIHNFPSESHPDEAGLMKQSNGGSHPFDTALEFHDDKGEVHLNSPNVTKTVKLTPSCLADGENGISEVKSTHEHIAVNAGNLSVIEDKGLEMSSSKSSRIAGESVEGISTAGEKLGAIENNLISLLVDLENNMISTGQDELPDGLKCSGKGNSPTSPMSHHPCLLEDDFPNLNLEIENEIKLFKVLCDVSPMELSSKEHKNGGDHGDVKECSKILSNSPPPTGNTFNSIVSDVIEDTSAEIASQIEDVDKILKLSREHLREDIVDILSIHENNIQFINGCKINESTQVMTERPSCVEGSSGSWMKTSEKGEIKDSHISCSNFGTSSVHDCNSFDSDDFITPDDMKSPCKTSDISVSSIVSHSGHKIPNDHHKKEENAYIPGPIECSGGVQNYQSSDEDSTYEDILTTLKVLEKEEREPVLLSSRPPPTGSEFQHTPRVKLKELLSYLDNVEQSCSSPLKSVEEDIETSNSEDFSMMSMQSKMRSDKFIEHSDPSDLISCNQIQGMRLQEQAKGLALLKKELEKTREKSVREKEKLKKKLEEEHAKIVSRHQGFIEKLLAEKKAINEKCEALIVKLQRTEESHKATIFSMEEHHAIELRNEHERARLELRATRDRWIREKTQKIQTATAKGAEGEVKRLVSEQVYQIEALWKARLDELRGRLEREAEEGMAKEREVARKRLEERMEEMERFHQEERRKFLAEECMLRGRAEEAERRIREVEEEARKRRAEDISAERARAQANLEKATDEIEQNYQILLSKERSQREMAAEAARKEERELMELEQRKRESKLKEQFRLERDRGIEKAVLHLTRQAEKTQQEMEAKTEMTLRRMRERCDEQVQIAETEAEKERKQCAEIRSQFAALMEENSSLKTSVSRLEKELETGHKLTTHLYEERSKVRELVVEEWSARVAALREEVGILKAQVVGEKERREMELAQVQKEREHELVQVQKRVEIAIAKKEETVNQVKSMYEAALKKCSQLQELLDKQRKDLLLK